MTASAVHARLAPVPVRVPAVASLALRPVFASSDATAQVLGVSSHAVWIRAGETVVVVSTRDATRLPNSLEVSAEAASHPFGSIEHQDRVMIGPGSVAFDGLTVEAVRWWDPRPVLAPVTSRHLCARVRGLPSSVPDVEAEHLRAALSTASPADLCTAATALLGRGPGLTPESDDYLAGALAATRILAPSVDATEPLTMLDDVADQLDRTARYRTTAFSAALISCAIRGEVAAPAGSFLRALTGRGSVRAAHRQLLSVGHTSGPALAAGIVLGAASLSERHSHLTPHTPNGGLQ